VKVQQLESPLKNRRWKFGCIPRAFLIGVVSMGTGVWLMNRWETLGGGGKTGAVVSVVIGTLLMLPLALITVGALIVKYFFHRLSKELSKAGEGIVGTSKAMYDKIHEFRDATDKDFENVDRDAYDASMRDFESAGFSHLGDTVDQTILEVQGQSPPIRIMSSADGTTVVGMYHLNTPMTPRSPDGSTTLFCDMTSEYDDGTFLVTSNTEGSDLMTPPPQIQRRQLPFETATQMLRARHETEKQKLLAAKSGVKCVSVSTLKDAIEMEKRQQAIKNAFRKGIGFIDPAEVRRIAHSVAPDDEDFKDMSEQAANTARGRQQEG
jgi:hypothetical protein